MSLLNLAELIGTGVSGAMSLYHAFSRGRGRVSRSTSKGPSGAKDVIKGRVNYVASVSLTAGAAQWVIDDGNTGCDSLLALGNLYRYYRFTNITLHFPKPNWSTAVFLAVAYNASANAAANPSFAQIESQYMTLLAAGQTVGAKLNVPGGAMNAQHGWFLTSGSATEKNAEQVGSFQFAAQTSSTETIYFRVTVDFEFCSLLDATTIGAFFGPRLLLPQEKAEENRIEEVHCTCYGSISMCHCK